MPFKDPTKLDIILGAAYRCKLCLAVCFIAAVMCVFASNWLALTYLFLIALLMISDQIRADLIRELKSYIDDMENTQ